MDRRGFLTEFVGGSIAPLVTSDLIEHGFAAALHSSYPSVDDWEQAVDSYGRDYMTSGAGEIQKRLAADLVVLQQQLDTPRLWAVSAPLATLYGKTFPARDGTKALTWYRHGPRSPTDPGRKKTRVWVRGRAAIALGYEDASLDAAELLAEQAIALDERPSIGRLSLMAARLGAEHVALHAQDEATRTLPASLPRFRTHLEMHRGLMFVRAGDHDGGTAYARAALDALPAKKHSLTLRMLMTEIERL